VLREKLENLGIEYLTEDEMRQRGFAKTPDIKLQVPIRIRLFFLWRFDCTAAFLWLCTGLCSTRSALLTPS
jgi:hypothetical protein